MKKIILLVSFLSALSINSQPVLEWLKTYNGLLSSTDEGKFAGFDNSGNVYSGGLTITSGGLDVCLITYSPTGTQTGVMIENGFGNGSEYLNDMAVGPAGNIYLTGKTYNSAAQGDNLFAIKYGPGNWWRYFRGDGNGIDEGTAMAVDAGGNVYVTGMVTRTATGGDIITIKYSPSGDTLWTRVFLEENSGSNETGKDIALDAQGNIYVAAQCYRTGTGLDFCTIKYDPQGNQQWVRFYSGPENAFSESPVKITAASSGIYVCGRSYTASTGIDIVTIKYDSTGLDYWTARYSSYLDSADYPACIKTDNSGNVYVGATSSGLTGNDYCLIKYNTSGSQQWEKRYNGAQNSADELRGMDIDSYGDIYVTGSTRVSPVNTDICTIKYKPNGDSAWVLIHNGPSSLGDFGNSVAVDNNGNIYITGSASGYSNGGLDAVTMKYSQPLFGIQQISNEVPAVYSLSQNYPNPFNPMTKIKFEIHKASNVNITVFDVLGRHITTLVNEKLGAGTYETEWNANNMPGGVYFYRLETGDFSETKKMILVK
jgi:hypothetical protein